MVKNALRPPWMPGGPSVGNRPPFLMRQGKEKKIVRIVPSLKPVLISAAMALFGAAVFGQEPATTPFEDELIELLRRRGVASDAECEALRARAGEMKRRNDLDAAVAAEVETMTARLAQDAPKLSYKQGSGFTAATADGNFSLTIGGRFQSRLEYEFEDDDDGDGGATDDLPNFLTPRVRLWFRGKAFTPKLTYDFQFEIGGDLPKGSVATTTTLTGGNPGETAASSSTFTGSDFVAEMKDGNLNYELAGKSAQVKAGQFKVPYARQQLSSVGRMEFIDRAIVDRLFSPGRNKGVMLWGRLGGEKDDLFEWNAGAFNGEGENRLNDDEGLMWAARAAVNPWGAVPYAEGDLRSEEERGKFLGALGVNAWYHQEDGLGANNTDAWSIGADLAAMWEGFFFTVEGHYRETDRATAASPPSDMELTGWFAQLGYMIVPRTFEVAVRYAEVDWDNALTQSAAREYLIVLGYFFQDHDLKAQLDFGRVENHFLSAGSNDEDLRLRMQVTLVF
jgi:phosphate-selective porin OprO and OprP